MLPDRGPPQVSQQEQANDRGRILPGATEHRARGHLYAANTEPCRQAPPPWRFPGLENERSPVRPQPGGERPDHLVRGHQSRPLAREALRAARPIRGIHKLQTLRRGVPQPDRLDPSRLRKTKPEPIVPSRSAPVARAADTSHTGCCRPVPRSTPVQTRMASWQAQPGAQRQRVSLPPQCASAGSSARWMSSS